ncbi:DsbA family protein [Paenibacillus mendelii]|uniref:DsbA family protein n=1 Tax=Paenibacillus mendelii TaxID=206163 RepID=A0ABV6J5Y2_9BACL|nr:DsbA family protein [Paenibacillus mendelii]MCQ6559444.1 DsbA family protein [Paenibacillus mendelii]
MGEARKGQAVKGQAVKGSSKRPPVKKGPRNLIIFTAIIVVLFVLMVVLNQAAKEPVTLDKAPDITNQPVEGSQEAKVNIVEFGDYKCPTCKAWGEQIYPKLKKDYIDTGKVKFSYINVLFHGEESKLGAIAGESIWAQNPEAFWPFHEALFKAQPAVNHDDLWLTPEKVLEVAGTISPAIDADKLKSDMDSQATLPQVELDEKLVEEFKITGTPTIMINKVKLDDPFDYDAIVKLIEEGQ